MIFFTFDIKSKFNEVYVIQIVYEKKTIFYSLKLCVKNMKYLIYFITTYKSRLILF